MRDPIDELENFDPGPAMTPMSAADVRRRGDRIRRRTNALATVGGLAAVAAIAVPFAVFAGGQNQPDSTPPPATQDPSPSVTWVTEIPGDFDLSVGMGDEQTEVTTSDDAIVIQNVCGVGWYVLPDPADQLSASMENPDSEGGHDRHLVVFENGQQAAAAFQQFAEAPTGCDGVYNDEGYRYEMIPAAVDGSGAEAASAWVQSEHDQAGPVATGYVTVAQQVGNALLIDRALSGAAGDENRRQDEVDNLVDRAQDVVSSMCAFSADGCGSDAETAEDPAVGEGAVPAIPAGFPLDEGLPTSESFGDTVPSPEPSACDETVPTAPNAVETANAQWRSVSEIRDRQLLTFASQAEAEAYVQRVVGVYCVEDDHGGGFSRVSRVYPGPLGDYSAAAVSHNEVDGEVSEGLILTEVVRVGRAVLLYQRIDEPYTFAGDVDRESTLLMDEGFQELEPVVAAMCTFTETGC